jgi:photosystem II stability/assembly factor-like uncharacterized protein
MSRILDLLLLCSLLSSTDIQAQWNVEKCSTSKNLNSISILSNNSGWIVGDYGTILFKINNTWKEYQKLTSANLYSIFMINEKNGWAVGSNGTIIHFDGISWKQYTSPTKNKLLFVCFKNSDTGIATGESGTILIFKDGIWNLVENEMLGNLYTASFENDDVWIGGWRENINVPILKIGLSKRLNIYTRFNHFSSVTGLAFLNSFDGWAVGSPSFVLHYDGFSWKRFDVKDNFSSLNSVFFSDENNGISVGFNGTILTYDGETWLKQSSPVTRKLNYACISGGSYYVVGDSGTIISKGQNPDYFSSYTETNSLKIDIYPNPGDNIINFILPPESMFEASFLSLINVEGEVVMKKEINIGFLGLISQINTSGLDNGIYFLKALTTEGKTAYGKFIIKH